MLRIMNEIRHSMINLTISQQYSSNKQINVKVRVRRMMGGEDEKARRKGCEE